MKLEKWEIEEAVDFVKGWMAWVNEHGPYAPTYYYEKLFDKLQRMIDTIEEQESDVNG